MKSLLHSLNRPKPLAVALPAQDPLHLMGKRGISHLQHHGRKILGHRCLAGIGLLTFACATLDFAKAGPGDLEGTWTTTTTQSLKLMNLPGKTEKIAGTCEFSETGSSTGTFRIVETSLGAKRTYTGKLVCSSTKLALTFKSLQFEPLLKTWFRKIARAQGWKITNLKVKCNTCTTGAANPGGRPIKVVTEITGQFTVRINGKTARKSFTYRHATDFKPLALPPPKATAPNPADGQTTAVTNPELTWSDLGGQISYDISFGTSNPPPFVTHTPTPGYTPGPLTGGTTYYWRVDTRKGGRITPGDVWSFTTPSVSYALRINLTGTGFGSVTDSTGLISSSIRTYPKGSVVRLTATASSGSSFAGWFGDYTSLAGNACTVTMNGNRAVTATFSLVLVIPKSTTIYVTYDNVLVKSSTGTGPENTVYSGSDLAVGSIWQYWIIAGYWSFDFWSSALYFQLDEVAGKTINSAVLRLYPRDLPLDQSGTYHYEIRAFSANWNPSTITWNNASGLATRTTGARQVQPPVTTVLPVEFDVTYIVQQWASGNWPNQGLRLGMYNNNWDHPYNTPVFRMTTFCSKEVYDGDATKRPKLVISYQ